ncbi:MAG: purine-nucleoside phosphorylase, partial [Calditrichaeota bacterium]|nr:purine-nucleoside phosphorylase [Calditrichota bacterium]
MTVTNQLKEAFDYLSNRLQFKPEIAIILGSGLGRFSELLSDPQIIPGHEIPHYPKSTVEGHAGNLIVAKLHNKPLIAIQGRSHFYEGYTLSDVVFSVRLMALLGVKTLIVSNASGALNPDFHPGDLMLINDQINFTFQNPLIGKNLDDIGDRFPDMSQP